jgi:phospholipase/carboxylesterase
MSEKPAELNYHYLYQAPSTNAEQAPLLVMLHGYGSHENDLYSMREYFGQEFHYASLRAPLQLGFGGFAWYQLRYSEIGQMQSDVEFAKKSRDGILQFVQELKKALQLKVDHPTWLIGFSQGAILSYGFALSHPKVFSRVAALSGYVLKDLVPEKYLPANLKHLDFFISHGTEDGIIPVKAARDTVAFLEKIGVNHQYREYPAEHGLNAENMQDLIQWVKA